jgi:hypothetical protein
MDTILRLFNASGNELARNYDIPGQTISQGVYSRIVYTFTATGTYYVGVSGNPNQNYNPNVAGSGGNARSRGTYSLDLALVALAPDNVGDTLANALVTGLGERGRTSRGYTMPEARIGDNQYLSKDVDLYRFEGTAGQTIIATTSQAESGAYTDTWLRLFDADGRQLTANDDFNGTQSRIEYLLTTTGTFYVGASGRQRHRPALRRRRLRP